MRTLLAIVSFALAAVPFGMLAIVLLQAMTEPGAIEEIIHSREITAILAGFLLLGSVFLAAGIAVLVWPGGRADS